MFNYNKYREECQTSKTTIKVVITTTLLITTTSKTKQGFEGKTVISMVIYLAWCFHAVPCENSNFPSSFLHFEITIDLHL